MVHHSSVQLLPSLTHALRAAAPACNAALWCCSRAFSSSTPHLQQQQQQQETAEPLTGLAFDEVFVQQGGPYAGSSSSNGSEDQAIQEPITAVFLHGLLGSSRNWRSFSRKLAQDAAARTNRDVRMLLVDLRCHGDSASRYGLHPPHSMAAAANDVAQLIKQQLGGQAPHLLAGLSLGGKVALQLLKQMVEEEEQQQQQQQAAGQYHHHGMYEAAPPISPPEDFKLSCSLPNTTTSSSSSSQASSSSLPTAAANATDAVASSQLPQPPFRGLPQQVWVLDSQPGTVPLDVDAPTSVGKIIQLIHQIPTPLPNRQALYKYLEPKGIPLPVAQWLGTSLVPGGRWGSSSSSSSGNGNGSSDQQLDWVFDITGAAALYNSYRLSSYWDVLTQPPPGVVVHLVRGELSDRWTSHMLQQLADAEAKWQEASSEAPENVGELQLHVLEKAGHWLQADNPEGLAALMSPWLKDLHQARLLW
uniref:AB hydrolase-1 domain-containing protein n=1 Tax=Tetradesmus obliquus TaxID=3088 RepID=A0A383VT47_TETOB|eukprot:jgi/Sobl393_1/4518/SZX67914.1